MHSDIYVCLPSIRPVTTLYGLAPQRAGTGQVESLQSYLLSLAHAHRVSPHQLAAQVLAPLRQCKLAPFALQVDWKTEAGKNMLGTTRRVENWLHILGYATGRQDIAYSSLYPLRAHINGEGLFSPVLRHCPQCLRDDIAEGRLTYRRLLWHLAVVTCCPIHATTMVESTCGRPTEEHLSSLLRKQLGGICTSCGSVGHACCTGAVAKASAEELWKARQCERLLGKLSSVEAISLLTVKAAVLAFAQAEERGIAGVAERAGMAKSELWRWLHTPSARLSLGGYLKLSACGGWSLVGLLAADLTQEEKPRRISVGRGRPERRAIDYNDMRHRLERAIDESTPLAHVTRELHVSRKLLRTRYPELCDVVSRRTNERHIEKQNSLQDDAIRQAETTLLTLKRLHKTSTLRNAREVTGESWFPSELRSRIFGTLRTVIDGVESRSLHRYELGERMVAAIALAQKRIRAAL